MAKDYWIGFDLGGTKMLAVVYDDNFKKLGSEKRKTRGFEGQKAGVKRILESIETAIKDAGVEAKELKGIGIGCPGPIDLETGRIIEAPNLSWTDVPIQKELEQAFGCPAVVMNDVDAGTYGEYRFGAGRGARTMVGIFPGTGIGSGCVYDGEILRGGKTSCMELGHIPVLRGMSLEEVASRLTIASRAAMAAYRGEAPHLLEIAGTDLSEIRSGALREAIEHGDQAIEDIVRESARWIGQATAMMVNIFAPEIVVLGGGLVEALPDIYLKEVREASKEIVMPAFRKVFKVKIAELDDDAAVIGAAASAQHHFADS